MSAENKSILEQELEPLNAQIELVKRKIESLEGELRAAEVELEEFSAGKERLDALEDVCKAFEKLSELEADELFWNELPEAKDPTELVGRLRTKVVRFEAETREEQEKLSALREQISQQYDEQDWLATEVIDAYARDERRQEEFIIEREISAVAFRKLIMPWTTDDEGERYFRRSLLLAILLCIVFGSLIPLINVPVPDRANRVIEIPERLAMLVKEPPKPEPIPIPEEVKPEKEPDKKKPEKVKKKKPVKKPTKVAAKSRNKAARKKAESTGVLAFKDTFKDLMDETPVARLGTEARINKNAPLAAGQARAQRSMVAIQATGTSGGISNAAVSRNIGAGGNGNGDRIGDVAFARVESAVAGLAEEAGRPLSDGLGPARTDEEIQIVFDRYKATLYRIYNKALRKDPTLRGKLLLRLTIEPGGEVSMCKMESTDLTSAELVAKIVDRVNRFNFGPKEDVPKVTILYPIDFLPAG